MNTKIITEQVIVTPQMAMQYLDTNHDNRRVNQDRVKLFAEDMRMGRWKLNHQGLAFDENGELFDGQHRLWAVIEADKSIEFMITKGLSRDVVTTIDAGRSRSIADQLHMVDHVPNSNRVVAALNAMRNIPTKHRNGFSTYGMIKEETDKYKKEIEWVLKYYTPRNCRLMKAPVAAALMYAYSVNPEKVDAFAMSYCNGDQPELTDPTRALRDYVLLRMPGKRIEQRELSLKALNCIMSYLEGDKVTKLYATESVVYYFKAHNSTVKPTKKVGKIYRRRKLT
jgi:hypothetical protein